MLGSLLAAGVSATACDIENTQHDQRTIGPAITIVGTNIDANGGVIPSNGVLQISFDRYLLPSTIVRQSYVVVDNANAPIIGLTTIYDPVARTVTIFGAEGIGKAWLTPDQSYKLVLTIPQDKNSDLGGFRAIDRATLLEAQKREFVFRAGPLSAASSYEPAVDFCADVMPIFYNKCSDPVCHGSSDSPAASLVLQSADGVEVTAKNRVAQGANTGSKAFSPLDPGPVFGVNMALIKPGDPGSSWLMYKIEMAPQPVIDAGAAPPVSCILPANAPAIPPPSQPFTPLAPSRTTADDLERSILNDYVLGREMPYPGKGADYYRQPLTFQERERIRMWIARGAETRNCGACFTPDTSSVDAGPVDASDQ